MDKPIISLEDFKKIDIKIGEILSAEKVPETDKLLKLSVNFDEEKPRQIISGISVYFPDPQVLVGKKCSFVANLEPRVIRGLESQGMILAISGSLPVQAGDANNNFFSLLEVSQDIPSGTSAK